MAKASFHVTIDEELLREMRLRCVSEEVSYSDFVEDAIRVKLGRWESRQEKKSKVEPPSKPESKIEVFSESSERDVYSTCCDAPIKRNNRNLLACTKCGGVMK